MYFFGQIWTTPYFDFHSNKQQLTTAIKGVQRKQRKILYRNPPYPEEGTLNGLPFSPSPGFKGFWKKNKKNNGNALGKWSCPTPPTMLGFFDITSYFQMYDLFSCIFATRKKVDPLFFLAESEFCLCFWKAGIWAFRNIIQVVNSKDH